MDPREPRPTPREANLVRPYTLTAGRTGTTVDLPLEAPIQTLQAGLAHRWPPDDARGKITQICVDTPNPPRNLGPAGFAIGGRPRVGRGSRDGRLPSGA